MRRLAWLNDIHLGFIDADARGLFARRVADSRPDAVLIGGDIGEGRSFPLYLLEMSGSVDAPIYFVLGNHDCYGSSIGRARRAAGMLSRQSSNLHWLPDAGVVELTATTALVGHGGWADGRLGDYQGSDVLLNDYFLIAELAWLDPQERLATLQRLGDEAAEHFRKVLPQALRSFQEVIVLTHVPPFREASWHEGKISRDNWLPHMSCKAAGEVLRELMQQHPRARMTVLCGHTHGRGEAAILDNLTVLTGGADYGRPGVQRIIEAP